MENTFIQGLTYPENLLKGREAREASVIGCLLEDPLLLDESGLEEGSFITLDGRFFYRLIRLLRVNNLEKADENSILSLQDETLAEQCEARHGETLLEVVDDLIAGIDLTNWETYLDQLVRDNILCKAWDNHMLPVEPVKLGGQNLNIIEDCRNLSASETIELFELLVSEFSGREFSNSGVIEKQYIDFNDEWLASLNKGEERGVPFAGSFEDINGDTIPVYPHLSNMLLGLRPGTLSMLGGFSSAGKSTFFVGIIMSLISSGHKVAYISNEENASRFMLKSLVWIAHNVFGEKDLTKRKISNGDHDEYAKEVIDKARAYWKEQEFDQNILYIQLPDASMKTLRKQIRTVAQNGFDVVIYDTFKLMISDMKGSRSDLDLIRDSRELYTLAGKYNLIMLASMQLGERYKGTLWLDSSALSNSKQVKEVLENLVMIRNVYKSELDESSKDYIKPFKRVKNEDGIYVREKVELNADDNWRVLFVEKSRGGANSEDTGVAIMYRFDGDYSTFVEWCQCEPKHGQLSDNKRDGN